MRRAMAVLLVAATIAGCGKDSTSPKTTFTGTWSYNVTTLTATGLNGSCIMPASSFTVVEASNDSLTGTYGGGKLVCTVNAATDSVTIPAGLAARGVAKGDSLHIEFDGSYWTSVGVRSGNQLSGTVLLHASVMNAGPYDLTADWTGSKQ